MIGTTFRARSRVMVLCLFLVGGLLPLRGPAADDLTEKQRQELAMKAHELNERAVSLYRRGAYAEATALMRQALAIDRVLYPKEKYPQGQCDFATKLNNLGILLQAQGEYARAEVFYRDALAMRRALYPKAKYPQGHPDLATSLYDLGHLLKARGEYARAEPFYRETLEMNRALYPKARYPQGHPALASSLNTLGSLLAAQGAYPRAEPFCREALKMWRALYPKAKYPQGHPHLATSLHNLGGLLSARGDYAKAEPFLREALAMDRGQLQRLAEVSAEAVALNFAATFPLTRDAYFSVTRRLPTAPAVYQQMWQRKALLSRVLERRHLDLLTSKDPKAHQLARELTVVRQRLARLLLTPVKDARAHARLLDQFTEAKESLEQRLAQLLRVKRAPATEPPQALAEALPRDAVFLDLIRYTDFDHDSTRPGKKGERRTPRYVAFVVRPGQKKAERIELGPAKPIEEAWQTWRQAIVTNRPDREAAARFARLTWEPLRQRLPAKLRTVYLSADDALTQVPWAALPGKKAGTVLLEDYALAYVPHGPWLLGQLKRPGKPPAAAGRPLVAGGIAYDRAPAAVEKAPAEELALRAPPLGGKGVVWKELPGTAREHEQIAALARKLFRTAPLSRSGAAASTAQLQEDLPRVRYAHLATHGFFADEQFLSAFQVDEKQFERLGLERRTAGARSPLTLSGLVLAGANRQDKEAAADRGILTAEALVGLRLDDLELAVLSACDTGRGDFRVAGGEGVYGLQRAFHLAGCKNVIASLWRVDDDATAALMGVFYRKLWQDKLPPLEALRQAQLYLYRNPSAIPALAKRRGDLFAETDLPKETVKPGAKVSHALTSQWAAFVLSGSGR